MSEHDEQASAVNIEPGQGDERSAVSEVLAAIQALDGRPAEEHVAVFELAHERLRRALDQRHG